MLNDIAATATFVFDYLLLFWLFKYLNAIVENVMVHIFLVAKFDNG